MLSARAAAMCSLVGAAPTLLGHLCRAGYEPSHASTTLAGFLSAAAFALALAIRLSVARARSASARALTLRFAGALTGAAGTLVSVFMSVMLQAFSVVKQPVSNVAQQHQHKCLS